MFYLFFTLSLYPLTITASILFCSSYFLCFFCPISFHTPIVIIWYNMMFFSCHSYLHKSLTILIPITEIEKSNIMSNTIYNILSLNLTKCLTTSILIPFSKDSIYLFPHSVLPQSILSNSTSNYHPLIT